MTTFFTLEESGNQQNRTVRLSIKDDAANLNDFIQLEQTDLHMLQAFQQRYKNRPQGIDQQTDLKKLGQDIYQWLNQHDWLDTITWLLTNHRLIANGLSIETLNFNHDACLLVF